MPHCFRRLLRGLVISTIALSLHSQPALSSTSSATEQAKLQALQDQIGKIREELEAARGEQRGLQDDLREAEKRIASIGLSIHGLDRELARQQRELRQLDGRKRELHGTLQDHYRGIADQIRASYVMGKQEYLKMLLNQQDPSRVTRMLAYYDYFNRARLARIQLIDQDLLALADVEQRIEQKTTELSDSRQRQAAEKQQLEDSQTERQEVLAKLDAGIESDSQRLDGLLRDEGDLKRLIESLRPALDDLAGESGDHTPFSRQKGKLAWPAKGRVVSRFGTSRGVGDLTWRGVMIAAAPGSEVRAVSHGRAAYADWLRGFGMLLIVDHGDGYMTLYGHNQSLYKDVGDWINTGDVIASVGNSGGREREGLYFEIRYKGQPTNPVKWCRAALE